MPFITAFDICALVVVAVNPIKAPVHLRRYAGYARPINTAENKAVRFD